MPLENRSSHYRRLISSKRDWLRCGLTLLTILSFKSAAFADELKILSSMPPRFTDIFVEKFVSENPEIDVIVLSKNTNSAIEELLRGNTRNFDIFWASSPEAFSVLKEDGQFNKTPKCRSSVKDSGGIATFAYSGLGWSQKTEGKLRPPRDWQDLLSPTYDGNIGIARPSRSGTTHMLVEYFLQVYGWEEGWKYIFELSGNFSTITARSFGVQDGLLNNRFDVGLSIDFLAQSLAPELTFTYGDPIVVLPAQIGILNNTTDEKESCAFVDFILSDDAQRKMVEPGINRIPANTKIRSSLDVVDVEIETAIRNSDANYDAELARSRYWAVNALFDVFIVEGLSKRRELWRRLKALPSSIDADKKLASEKRLSEIGVPQHISQSLELNLLPFQLSNIALNNDVQNVTLDRWREIAQSNLNEAEQIIYLLETNLQ